MATSMKPADGSLTLAEIKEFASFDAAAQRYIRRSLDVAYCRSDALALWSRDVVEAASIRAQTKTYEALPGLRQAIPEDSGLSQLEGFLGLLIRISAFDLGQDGGGGAIVDAVEPYQRRAADGVRVVFEPGHGEQSSKLRSRRNATAPERDAACGADSAGRAFVGRVFAAARCKLAQAVGSVWLKGAFMTVIHVLNETTFEWDDQKAGHAHRLSQARSLIRSVRRPSPSMTQVQPLNSMSMPS